jgi:mRNA-degrading endonuclease RelE of RelBE toxin-antitoxin system
LRRGEYRVFFDLKGDDAIEIAAVRHRKEAYLPPPPAFFCKCGF